MDELTNVASNDTGNIFVECYAVLNIIY